MNLDLEETSVELSDGLEQGAGPKPLVKERETADAGNNRELLLASGRRKCKAPVEAAALTGGRGTSPA